MYKKEINELQEIVRKENDGDKIYKRVQEEVKGWNKQKIERVYKALQRGYEIGTPNDAIPEFITCCLAVYGLVISCLALVCADSCKVDWRVVVIIIVVFIILITARIVFVFWSYWRKRKLRVLIDVFAELCEDMKSSSRGDKKYEKEDIRYNFMSLPCRGSYWLRRR